MNKFNLLNYNLSQFYTSIQIIFFILLGCFGTCLNYDDYIHTQRFSPGVSRHEESSLIDNCITSIIFVYLYKFHVQNLYIYDIRYFFLIHSIYSCIFKHNVYYPKRINNIIW